MPISAVFEMHSRSVDNDLIRTIGRRAGRRGAWVAGRFRR